MLISTLILIVSIVTSTQTTCPPDKTDGCCDSPSENAIACSGLTNLSSLFAFTDRATHSINVINSSIPSIVSGTFFRLGVRLQQLYLDADNIETIEPGAFRGLDDLETLSLERNRLRLISPGTFSGLGRLKVLNLAGNILYAVDVGTFAVADVPLLTVLDLRECRIVDFQPAALSNLTFLYTVNMSGNRLTSFPDFGMGLDNLFDVDLSSNEIRSLDGASLVPPGPRTLRLSRNSIERLTARSIFAYPSPLAQGYRLQELVLDRNSLIEVEVGSLSGLSNLTYLHLSYNRLTAIPSKALPWSTIRMLIVHDNPWNCSAAVDRTSQQSDDGGCINGWMVNKSTEVHIRSENSTLMCASPPSLAGKNIYLDKVLDICIRSSESDGTSVSHRASLYVALIFLIFSVGASWAVIITVRRRRARRPIVDESSASGTHDSCCGIYRLLSSLANQRRPATGKNPTEGVDDDDDNTWSPSTMGYRQMDDFNTGPYSSDQNEL